MSKHIETLNSFVNPNACNEAVLNCIDDIKKENLQLLATAIVDGLLASYPRTQNGVLWSESSKEPAPSFFCAFEKLIDVLVTAKSSGSTEAIIEKLLAALSNAKLKALPKD